MEEHDAQGDAHHRVHHREDLPRHRLGGGVAVACSGEEGHSNGLLQGGCNLKSFCFFVTVEKDNHDKHKQKCHTLLNQDISLTVDIVLIKIIFKISYKCMNNILKTDSKLLTDN